jgi:hypothetical protein
MFSLMSDDAWGRSILADGAIHSGRTGMWGYTDEAGRFAFGGLAPGHFRFSARTDPSTNIDEPCGEAEAGAQDLVLRLESWSAAAAAAKAAAAEAVKWPSLTVSGVVLDDDGTPLPAATVRLDGNKATTDAAGAFHFERISDSGVALYAGCAGHATLVTQRFKLEHDLHGLVVHLAHVAALRGRLDVEPGMNVSAATMELACTLRDQRSLSSDDGPPISASWDAGSTSTWSLHPSSDGHFEWTNLPPGGYVLSARAVSDDFLRDGGRNGAPSPAISTQAVTLHAGETTELTLAVPRRGGLSGVVTVEGLRVAGAEVAAVVGERTGGSAVARAWSDGDGAWCLDGLPPSHYQIVCHAPGSFVPLVSRAEVAAGQRAEDVSGIDFDFTGPSIVGRVQREADGSDVAGASIALLPPILGWCGVRDPSVMDWRRLGGSFGELVLTDEHGAFRIEHVPDGLYEVNLDQDLDHLRPVVRGAIVLVPRSPDGASGVMGFGGVRPLQDPGAVLIQVLPASSKGPPSLRCHVTWPDGTPFRSAGAELLPPGGELKTYGAPAVDGSIELWAPQSGDYDLIVTDREASGHEVLRRPLHLEVSQTLELTLAVP